MDKTESDVCQEFIIVKISEFIEKISGFSLLLTDGMDAVWPPRRLHGQPWPG